MCYIEYSDEANDDMRDLFYFIAYEKGMLQTAQKYLQGLKKTIENMAEHPTAYSVRYYSSLAKYGNYIRRVDYKKMAVLYSFHNDVVYIHRVIAGSMITGFSLN